MRDQQYISFSLDDHLFGIDILLVREIIRNFEFTPVEHAPEGVQGLLNLRGQIITVLDLRGVLGLPPGRPEDEQHCIILKTSDETARFLDGEIVTDVAGDETVGVLVDDIADVILVGQGDIEAPPANANGVDGDKLSGVAKLENQLLLVLSMRKVMENWASRNRGKYAGISR